MGSILISPIKVPYWGHITLYFQEIAFQRDQKHQNVTY